MHNGSILFRGGQHKARRTLIPIIRTKLLKQHENVDHDRCFDDYDTISHTHKVEKRPLSIFSQVCTSFAMGPASLRAYATIYLGGMMFLRLLTSSLLVQIVKPEAVSMMLMLW